MHEIVVSSASGDPVVWTPDRDCQLRAVYSFIGYVLISFDPELTALVTTDDSVNEKLMLDSYVSTNVFDLKLDIAKGQKVFIHPVSGAALVALFIEDSQLNSASVFS